MLSFLPLQTELAIYLVGSFVFFFFALWVGNESGDRGSPSRTDRVGRSADSVFRLSWAIRMTQDCWRLPGVKLNPQRCSLGDVGSACSVEYASRLGKVIRNISYRAI